MSHKENKGMGKLESLWESRKSVRERSNVMLAAENQLHSISIVPDILFKRS